MIERLRDRSGRSAGALGPGAESTSASCSRGSGASLTSSRWSSAWRRRPNPVFRSIPDDSRTSSTARPRCSTTSRTSPPGRPARSRSATRRPGPDREQAHSAGRSRLAHAAAPLDGHSVPADGASAAARNDGGRVPALQEAERAVRRDARVERPGHGGGPARGASSAATTARPSRGLSCVHVEAHALHGLHEERLRSALRLHAHGAHGAQIAMRKDDQRKVVARTHLGEITGARTRPASPSCARRGRRGRCSWPCSATPRSGSAKCSRSPKWAIEPVRRDHGLRPAHRDRFGDLVQQHLRFVSLARGRDRLRRGLLDATSLYPAHEEARPAPRGARPIGVAHRPPPVEGA